jgi:hypothetical protein
VDRRSTSLRSFRPEAGRLWLRRAFRGWPGSERPWVDLGEGGLGRRSGGGGLPEPNAIERDGGLLYIPPVDPGLAPERDALVAALARRAVPLLVQIGPGERLELAGAAPEAIVVDLLDALWSQSIEALDAVPRGSIALWPLVPGLTDDPAWWDDGCRRLRAAGAACAQAVAPELSPAERRKLVGEANGGARFSRIFHGRAAEERSFAVTAARHGLEVFFRRPRALSDRPSRNAELAELLALAAELWLRLGRGEAAGQQLFRASRWVEDTDVDVRALAREGNLGLVDTLRPTAAELITEWGLTGRSRTIDAWLDEYVG